MTKINIMPLYYILLLSNRLQNIYIILIFLTKLKENYDFYFKQNGLWAYNVLVRLSINKKWNVQENK